MRRILVFGKRDEAVFLKVKRDKRKQPQDARFNEISVGSILVEAAP
ncbi:hypothetical protein SAMN03084138_00826 [Enterovibrio norvegicus DSM 15893]|uniref:Uncharacterized protein n=1 Tax=Enterovibrio norvegicus DSM 15893 TaxID=1121869 RepID=A0A1I5L0C4_9GAMM|nr:hypothetical protein SAMN03084138_00826 [Enterovibrio norvegicus DSM 15893]